MKIFKLWFANVLLSLDMLGNALLGGDPFETISSRAGKSKNAWACYLCRFLDWLQKDHCKNAVNASAGSRALQNHGL